MKPYLIDFMPDWHRLVREVREADIPTFDPVLDVACAERVEGGVEGWERHKARKPWAAAQFAEHVAALLAQPRSPAGVRIRRRVP